MQKLFGEDVVKTKMINFAGQVLIQYEKEIDESNQIFKKNENEIQDDKIEKDVSKEFLKVT